MKKREWIVAAASALALALAGPAFAQEDEMEPPTFEDVDANENGVISESEAALVPGLDFSSADTNQ
jgi:hypothetical protein